MMGRKPKLPEEKFIKFTITLDPDIGRNLKENFADGKRSAEINRCVRKVWKEEGKLG